MDEIEVLLDRDELLVDIMHTVAYRQAASQLSEEGKELLKMFSDAAAYTNTGAVEVYQESAAFDRLPWGDQRVIEIYLARDTLIEEFRTFGG